jgi:hypothetical protein
MAWIALHPAWSHAGSDPLGSLRSQVEKQVPATALKSDLQGNVTLEAPLQDLEGLVGPTGLTVHSTSASEGGGGFSL